MPQYFSSDGEPPDSDGPQLFALYLGMVDTDFEVVASPGLVAAVRALIERYERALGQLV
ncbi:hypothetical protein [Nocardia wallacei]|uniref:hypothetical protein n=1 Tax=Nocardia wallacei TaxID=480035 RepID=UPI00245900F6|nr:hypothetical protein [Nocardia wallacei]